MLGDSLVLKQTSQYYEYFYSELKPWKHYVPIKRSLDDLLEKIKWAKVSGVTNKVKRGTLTYKQTHS
ncbi:cyclase [Platysternon megacephalum]|uniref:Cyclase n=1 Tax=Platysternon megacephalum TaxID=55544 RepID=A0A4D9DLJ9_9SAUR|nr:cyclase [Platysternon megacephalum]